MGATPGIEISARVHAASLKLLYAASMQKYVSGAPTLLVVTVSTLRGQMVTTWDMAS